MTHNPPMQHADDILRFWFDELTPAQHFAQDDALDALIRTRFGATWEAARQCELWGWRATPQGRLAEILVLDQFSRNVHRGSPLAFAQDGEIKVGVLFSLTGTTAIIEESLNKATLMAIEGQEGVSD